MTNAMSICNRWEMTNQNFADFAKENSVQLGYTVAVIEAISLFMGHQKLPHLLMELPIASTSLQRMFCSSSQYNTGLAPLPTAVEHVTKTLARGISGALDTSLLYLNVAGSTVSDLANRVKEYSRG
jgi:hypothetical protein